MYPLRDERLALGDIATHWSRDLPQHPLRNELLNNLMQAFWRGELTLHSFFPGNEPMLPVRMLEVIDAHERPKGPDAEILVGATENELPPENSEGDDGTMIVHFRPRLLLSAQRPWREEIVDKAAEVMSNLNWDDYPDDLAPQIMRFLASKEDFASYCDRAGYDRPSFWFNRRASPAQLSSNRARNQALKWFREKISGPKQGPKAWYFKKAAEEFDGLSYRSFEKIWNAHAPDDWRKAGKPISTSPRRRD